MSASGYASGVMTNYVAGDKFRVAVEGGLLKFQKNAVTIYTGGAVAYPLYADVTMWQIGATVNNVKIGSDGAQNATWSSLSGVAASGNSLTQNAGFGYYYGGVATQTLSGDGYVEFTASATVGGPDYRFVGLSHVATVYWQSFDYSWRLDPDGTANVCFGGYASGVMTNYVAGDKFRVSVEGGVLKFQKNGVTIYTGGAPSYPLYADVTMWQIGATVNNVRISSGSSTAQVRWLVTDQLGTPRMIFDQSGNLDKMSRHDYLPFGEELLTSNRTSSLGYTNADGARQKYTGYERDTETGLDYAHARYYANMQGRFTSPDPFAGSATIGNPQTFNRYNYVGNNPVNATDPLGLVSQPGGHNISNWNGASAVADATEGISPWADTPTDSTDTHSASSENNNGHAGANSSVGSHEAPDATPQNPALPPDLKQQVQSTVTNCADYMNSLLNALGSKYTAETFAAETPGNLFDRVGMNRITIDHNEFVKVGEPTAAGLAEDNPRRIFINTGVTAIARVTTFELLHHAASSGMFNDHKLDDAVIKLMNPADQTAARAEMKAKGYMRSTIAHRELNKNCFNKGR